MDPRFKHPFTCLVAGPTGCGKTFLVSRLIEFSQELIVPPPRKVLWYYGQWQDQYKNFRGVEFRQDLETIQNEDIDGALIIIDDLMNDINKGVQELFIKGSHHKNASVILILQNIFGKNPFLRTISLNAHYLIIFNNPRDKQQIRTLAYQVEPGSPKILLDAFEEATRDHPHGYLLLDFAQTTPQKIRYRTHIFSPNPTVYISRKQ